MDENQDVIQEDTPEEVVEEVVEETLEVPEVVSEDVETPTPSAPEKTEEKVVPYSRFKEVNDKLNKLKNAPPVVNSGLDVEDYIDISASLEGLDKREKEYLAQQHKLTGLPLKEIRESEDYGFWQTAYKQKVEKELTLAPSGKQNETDKPKNLVDKLRGASLADSEKLLKEAGLYKDPRPTKERVNIDGTT